MAIYEYECEAGHRHERLRSMALRDEAATCLECGAEAVRVTSLAGLPWVRGGTPVHHRGSVRELDGRT